MMRESSLIHAFSSIRRGSRYAEPLPHEQEGFLPDALLKLDLLFETDPSRLDHLRGQEQALRERERQGTVRLRETKRVDLESIIKRTPELAAGDLESGIRYYPR